MRTRFFALLMASAALVLSAAPAHANELLGTTVGGGMYIDGDGQNCFAPGDNCEGGDLGPGLVQAVIGSASPLFVAPLYDFYTTANFTDSELEIYYDPDRGPGAVFAGDQFVFEDAAFSGLTLSLISYSGFPDTSDFSYSLSGDTITVDTAGLSDDTAPFTIDLALNSAAVPEPRSVYILIPLLLTLLPLFRRLAHG